MRHDAFDIGYWLLDDELIDADERRCGRVDDVEFEGGPGERVVISAILTGPGAWRNRLPQRFRGLATRLFGDGCTRVPWSEVEDISVTVQLKRPGDELGLGRGDDAMGQVIGKLPGA